MKESRAHIGLMQAIQKRFRSVLVLAGMQAFAAPLLAGSVHPGCSSDQHCSAGASCETWITGLSRVENCVLRTDGIAVIFREGNVEPVPRLYMAISAIELSGVITNDKVARLRQIMAKYKPRVPQGTVGAWFEVMINSPGGDVYAAMELGRLFRANLVQISLDQWGIDRAQCASACILAWVGAPMRLAAGIPEEGMFVIHRPCGFADAGQDLSGSSNRWKTVQADIRQYLLEMNIPPALLDAMNEVSSQDGRALTASELSRYLLSVDDPAFSELQDASAAHKRGTSRMEYLARKRRVDECLKNHVNDPGIGAIFLCDKLYDIAADRRVPATP
jgi:hypothetical protein